MDAFCGECGKPCQAIVMDFGIGPYEYWGARGVDVQLAAVSDCCEGDVFADEEMAHLIDRYDVEHYYEPDYDDYEPDDYIDW